MQVFQYDGGGGGSRLTVLATAKVPMHQDGQYWALRPLATCTVWIAIDDATIENGEQSRPCYAATRTRRS